MTRTHPQSLIMLQYPIHYQLLLPSIYNTCQAELLLETKASTLCPIDHSTNLRGFKVSSNIDVTSDVHLYVSPNGRFKLKVAIHLSQSPFVDQGTEY